MISTRYGPKFRFGITRDKVALPEGWSYIEKEYHWLVAVSPSGDHYFVTEANVLHPRKEKSNGGFYVEMGEAIPL